MLRRRQRLGNHLQLAQTCPPEPLPPPAQHFRASFYSFCLFWHECRKIPKASIIHKAALSLSSARHSTATMFPITQVISQMLPARVRLAALRVDVGLGSAWLWPKVSNRRFAQNAIQEAFWAALIVSVLTAILTVILLFSPDETNFAQIGFLNSALFGGLAFGIYRRSRTAALSAFVLFTAGAVYQLATAGPGGLLLRGLVALAFFHGVRGTFAYQKLPALPANLPSIEQSFGPSGKPLHKLKTIWKAAQKVKSSFP